MTIIRELYLYLTKVIFMLKHSVLLFRLSHKLNHSRLFLRLALLWTKRTSFLSAEISNQLKLWIVRHLVGCPSTEGDPPWHLVCIIQSDIKVCYLRAPLVRPAVSRSLDWSPWSRRGLQTSPHLIFACGGIWRPWCTRWKYKMWTT